MNQIPPEALNFLEEAKRGFNNIETVTYIDKNKEFIALRTGFREDCLSVYELGNEIGNFTDQLPKQHTVIIDYDELDRYKKLEIKLYKLHADLLQMKKVNNCTYVDINYMLNVIENEK